MGDIKKSGPAQPTKAELVSYAKYLGMDPIADHDLLWIARDALLAPLPHDWSEHFDEEDRVFYFNGDTRESSWTPPYENVYRDVYAVVVKCRNDPHAPATRDTLDAFRQELARLRHDVKRTMDDWKEHQNDQGHSFFYNHRTRKSVWRDPRPAKCDILHLKEKALDCLQLCNTPGHSDREKSREASRGKSRGQSSEKSRDTNGVHQGRDNMNQNVLNQNVKEGGFRDNMSQPSPYHAKVPDAPQYHPKTASTRESHSRRSAGTVDRQYHDGHSRDSAHARDTHHDFVEQHQHHDVYHRHPDYDDPRDARDSHAFGSNFDPPNVYNDTPQDHPYVQHSYDARPMSRADGYGSRQGGRGYRLDDS